MSWTVLLSFRCLMYSIIAKCHSRKHNDLAVKVFADNNARKLALAICVRSINSRSIEQRTLRIDSRYIEQCTYIVLTILELDVCMYRRKQLLIVSGSVKRNRGVLSHKVKIDGKKAIIINRDVFDASDSPYSHLRVYVCMWERLI